MVHTTQDYSGKYRQEVVYGNIDNAEVATRTYPLSSVDRRGNWVWVDDFEAANAAKWKTYAALAGTTALSTDRAWHGNQSMRMTTDAHVNDDCYISKSFALPFSRRMGAEVYAKLHTNKPNIIMDILGYSGTFYYRGSMYYSFNLDKLYYRDSTNNWVELTVYDEVVLTDEKWIPIKLVVDWDSQYYMRLIFAGTLYDLSNYPLYATASALAQQVYVIIYTTAGTAAAATVYYDNFIFTQNE